MTDVYDLVVIGAGSGGVRAGRMAASTGARVAIIEDLYLGGTCVNVGCVPKKLYVYASEYAGHLKDAAGFGVDLSLEAFDWSRLVNNKTNEINRLNSIYDNLLESSGCDVIRGKGVVTSPETVEVNGQSLAARRILIATGGWPFMPDVPGIEFAIDSNQVFGLDQFPKRLVVVGGGYIAVEFAGIFNGLGAETTLLYRGDQILRGFDNEIRDYVSHEITKTGVAVRTQTDVESISRKDGGELSLLLSDGSRIECDAVMYATGRKPRTEGLGLESVGVHTSEAGTVIADDHFRTNVPGIYALGDVIGTPALTPVALEQAMVFVNQQFGDDSRQMNYDIIPTAVFCQPNIGTIGLTEEEACERHPVDVDIYCSEFRPLKHTLSGSQERTLMKLIVRRSDDRVIGAHMVGPDAGEIMQGLAVAMTAGATKAHFDQTLGIHPTAAEEFVTMRSLTRSM